MIRLNQTDLNQYLKKTEAEQIYMKKINSINMSFTSILTSIQSIVATYDYQFSTLNVRVGQIESNTSSHYNDIQTIQSWQNSAYSSITNITQNTSSLNNEISSIKTDTAQIASNTLMMSNLLSTLTGGGGFEYDYWEQFGEDSNKTYIDYAVGSTVVKNEQLSYNGNLSQSISNADKKEYVLNSNILNTLFTVNSPLERLGLKLNSTNSPLRATAENIDIAAYNDISLNDTFNLKCEKLNCISSGGYVKSIASNVWANTINFIGHPNSDYEFNLNPNVKALENLPTQATIGITNNGDNVISLTGNHLFSWDGSGNRTFNNFNLSSYPTLTRNGGSLLVSNITANNDLYNRFNCSSVTMSNILVSRSMWCNSNTLSGIKLDNCSFKNNSIVNYYGHASISLTNNTFSNLSVFNPGWLDMVGNTCGYLKISGNLKGDQLTFSDNSISTGVVLFSSPGAGMYLFDNNTISSLIIKATTGQIGGFTNLKKLSAVSLEGADYKVYSLINTTNNNFRVTANISNGELLSNTYRTCILSNNVKLNICSFDYMTVKSPVYSNPQNWRYVTAGFVNYSNNSSVFFCNMLNVDNGFFHVKIQHFWQGVEEAFQNTDNTLDFGAEVLVDNLSTTSVNLGVVANANRKIHANFMSLQPSIQSVNFQGWLPSQIVDFDQYYMFNNVASDLVNQAVSFTLNVDHTSDWSNYKQFFNPFGDNNPDRVVLV